MFCKPICLFAAVLGLVAGDCSATKPAVADDAKPVNTPAVKKAGEVKPLHVGVWKARFSSGERILKFNPDGTFLYLSVDKGVSGTTLGRYKIEAGVVKYDIPKGTWKDVAVSFLGADLMHLRTVQKDGKLSSGVVYQRLKDRSQEKIDLTGTWKTTFAKDSTVIMQLDADGTFKTIQLLPSGQRVFTGQWEMRAGQLVLKTGQKEELFKVQRVDADAVHVRVVTAKDDNVGLFMHKSKA